MTRNDNFGDFYNSAPPHNIEAEQALLGAILVNNDCFHHVSDFLQPKHFFGATHRRVYELVAGLITAGKAVTSTTLKTFLPADLDVGNLTAEQYLRRLASEATTVINAKDYGHNIHDLALRRQAIEIHQEAIKEATIARVDDDPLQQINDVAAKLQQVVENDASNRRRRNLVDISNWDNEPLPERKWAIRDCVPLHQAGLFSGEGGTGKSILELAKDVAHVIGRDWLNLMPEPGPAIYFGAEDSKDEIHIRLAAIVKHYGVSFKELVEGGLHVLCFLGEDATLCAVNNGKSGKIETTKLYRQLYEMAGDIKPKNISIDTLSRAFAGDEIDRVQVYAFANCMQALAMVADGSVTVLSHPSLAGMNNGSGYSGSTAWHGAFRFRQYLTGVKAEGGDDGDLRQLEFKKNQYGPRGETIVVRYQNGLFLPERGMSNLDKAARAAEADRVFIDLLKRFLGAGRNVSDKSSSPNYAPKAFAKEAEAKKTNLRSAELEDAMRRLFAAENNRPDLRQAIEYPPAYRDQKCVASSLRPTPVQPPSYPVRPTSSA
jgi:RecA-family ATPase